MEPQDNNLPAKIPNLTYLYNSSTHKYDVIDLDTGKLHDTLANLDTDPAEYSVQMADLICDRVRAGETIAKICQTEGFPTLSRFYHWLSMHPELRIRYEQARLQRADAYHDKALTLATDRTLTKDDVPRAKLEIDTLKWAAEKADPDRYGNRKEALVTSQPSVIILNTGIDREGAPSIADLLMKKEPVTIEGEIISTTEVGEQYARQEKENATN